jgi:GMP synthase (glutamine-hydrolysing)
MKALIVYHVQKQDLGSIKEVLEARGFTLEYLEAQADELPNIAADAHDLTVILGGPMGVYEADQHPYLLNEIDYIQRRMKLDKPLLGICLGAQLIAKSLGSNVFKGTQGREVGWCDIHLNEAGIKSPMRHFASAQTKIVQAHQDTFDLPSCATLLASSDMYDIQAYNVGKNIMATQFHPEADKEILDYWLENKQEFFETGDHSPERMQKQAASYLPKLKNQTAFFINEWLDDVLPISEI